MNELEKKVYNNILEKQLIKDGDKIVVAVSGGPDSMCMLNVLKNIKKESKLTYNLYVAHINHLLREEANSEEQFVKEFCKKFDIPFFSKRYDIKKIAEEKKIGTEEAGRIARYTFFDEILEKTASNKIAIAHNKNDKIETIIMKVLRGSGITGLRGIEEKNEEKYIRPILNIERKDIEKYCEELKLEPRIDKTNFENIYTRNKIRNIVIPYIQQEFNPNIIDTINRLSELVSEEDDYLNKVILEKYKKIVIREEEEKIILDLKKFNLEENVICKRIILLAISKLKGNHFGIEKIHLEDIVKLCKNNVGNKYLTPNKYIKIYVNKGKIEICRQF